MRTFGRTAPEKVLQGPTVLPRGVDHRPGPRQDRTSVDGHRRGRSAIAGQIHTGIRKIIESMGLHSVPSVIDAIERAPEVVVPLVREVPHAFLKRRPASGKWSAHEHACHLAVVHALFVARLDQMLLNPEPVITPYDPGTQDPDDALLRLDLDESLESYVRDRARLVRRLRELTPEEWGKTAEHGEYSHYSVFIMFRHVSLHDFFHAYRIEELLLNRAWTTDDRAGQGRR